MNDLLRPREGHAAEKVSFVELFFDLVFVFAITQLSHSLIGHFSLTGALQTLMMLLAVWWVWIFTAWVTNWLDPEKLPVRCLLLVMMVLGLVLSAAIPDAFGARGLAFAGAYVTLQLGRSLFFLWAARGEADITPTFQRIICWFGTGSVLWITGGFLDGTARMACWGTALVIEYISPSAGFYVPGLGKSHSTDWQVSGRHMAERCGLFIIIALGESILVTGATFSELQWTTPLIVAFIASVIGSIAMWWLYFDSASDLGTQVISSSDNPGRLARLAYTYLHLFLVAGIILSAAADEFVLAHPTGHTDAKTAIALLGGAALYLLGNVLFKRAISGRILWSHLVAILPLGLLGVTALHLAPWLLATLTATMLIAVAWWERHSRCLEE
jgi:low temperature requirement protein LtrA